MHAGEKFVRGDHCRGAGQQQEHGQRRRAFYRYGRKGKYFGRLILFRKRKTVDRNPE